MKKLLSILLPLFLIQNVSAHCPLCTAGAGAAAGIATYLGIDFMVIGVLVGGFSWALGSWTAKWLRGKSGEMHRHQDLGVTILVFLSVVVPGIYWMPDYTPITLWMVGEYGRTLSFNNFLVGSILGGLIVWATPSISKKVSRERGETVPFQGMALTLILLALTSVLLELMVV